LFLLETLKFLELSFLFLLLPELVQFLLLLESFLLLEPDPLLVLQQERVPGLFHVQVAATHLDLLSRGREIQDVLGRVGGLKCAADEW